MPGGKGLKEFWYRKRVLITGASSGLGWAVAEALAPFEVQFGLLSRREERLQELTALLADSGSRFWYRACDVRDRSAVYEAVRAFADWAGGIDVAWVNSGIGGASSVNRWDWDRVEAMIDTNLKGAIYTTMACLEVMNRQGQGAIVGIGSAASMRGMPAHGIYSLTKIGLHYFFESLMPECPNIQFTVIHPGYVDTPINQGNPNRIWLMQPDRAARRMIRAVARRKRFYIFPFRMRLLYRLVRAMPDGMYQWIVKQYVKANQQ
jgi:short-subunit dehydrogenase